MNDQKGLALIPLIIVVIILIAIASIGIYYAYNTLINASIQTYETNMLKIKAKAIEYGEEIDVALWEYSEDDENEEEKMELLEEYGLVETSIDDVIATQLDSQIDNDNYAAYSIDGLIENNNLGEVQDNINDGEYIVVYNASDYTKVDVVYTGGILYNDEVYYTLSALQSVYLEE